MFEEDSKILKTSSRYTRESYLFLGILKALRFLEWCGEKVEIQEISRKYPGMSSKSWNQSIK